jgi:EAL domain-containing protein (putative c-di-GMP-specific phosphodiesterase class I)
MMALRFAQAVRRGQVFLEYQPIVSLTTGEPLAAEALLRWRHPRRGLIPPASFVPLVERSGYGGRLDSFVLEAAAAQARALREAGMHVPIAVNLRPRAFQDPSLPARLEQLSRRWGLTPSDLQIELTERALGDGDAPTGVITELADRGIPTALDDFGVGYSSLRRLALLPLDTVKIDRSLVDQITDSPGPRRDCEQRARVVVRAAAELGHALNLRVTAEGVETVEALDLLRDLGVDAAQGFLISRPVVASELASKLRENALSGLESHQEPRSPATMMMDTPGPPRSAEEAVGLRHLRQLPYG